MDLLSLFKEKFGISSSPLKMVKSPLRICPLGAHVDHQKGLVTGMALNSAVEMIYTANDDGFVQVQSMDFPDEENFHVNNVPGMVPGYWGNYLRGSILALKRSFVLKKGIKALIRGKIPIGGLSSSAAVMTVYLMALCDVNNIQLSNTELIDYSHWVENNFIGLNNGILDQAANILSKAGHLMFMDTATGEYELIPPGPAMPEYEVVVVYSGISTALISTDYNNWVDECKVSAWILQELAYREVASFKEANLRQVDYESYLKFRAELPERFQKRADHFFSENERVKKGVAAWKKGDLNSFGQLMFASGASSIENYQCGCPELITIYNLLRETPGVYGARFSGAGYRGCCIGLIDPEYKDTIKARIAAEYPLKHPEYKEVYQVNFCKTDDGARIIHL